MPNCVSVDAVHVAVTYCVLDGDEHALHVPEEPTALDVPATYPVMY